MKSYNFVRSNIEQFSDFWSIWGGHKALKIMIFSKHGKVELDMVFTMFATQLTGPELNKSDNEK